MKHHELNLLNLEDTSDFDSDAPTDDVSLDFEQDPDYFAQINNY